MRKLASFALPFAGAVFLAVYLLPGELWLPAGLLCALGTAACLFFHGDGRLRAALLTLGLAAGFLWSAGYEVLFLAPAYDLAGQETAVTAVADAWPRETAYGFSVTVRVRQEGRPEVKAILYLDEDASHIRPGDELTFTAEFRLADTLGGEESDYYFSRGIYLAAYGDGMPEVDRPERMPLRYLPALLARRLGEVLSALYPPEEAGVMAALITGDRTGLSASFYAALKRVGLAHVVAVSGMHLVFLVQLVQTLTRQKNHRRLALITIPVLLLFMAVTGFPASVVRAGVMEILLLLAPALGRERDGLTSLSLALLVLLAANPYSAADVGLQLSFASVAGILLLSTRMADWADRRWRLAEKRKGAKELARRAGRFVTGSLATTLGAMAFTTPLTAWYFGTISLLSPLANLLSLWAVSLAFALGLLSAVLGLVWLPLGELLAFFGALPVRYLLALAPFLGRFPFAAVPMRTPYLWLWLLLVYAVALGYLLWPGQRKRPVLPLSACALALAAALVCNAMTYTGGDLTVSVLDVGQGLCVVLRSQGQTVVVDCGGSGADNAGDVAADHLQSLGEGRVDLLVLTHYHADHTNGVAELMERLDVAALAAPDVEADDPLRDEILALAAAEGAEVFLLEEDANVDFGLAGLHLYAPLGRGDTNEEGLSVLASCGAYEALITGDMGEDVERRLVKYGDLPDIELLVVGHHGSRYSTGEALLLASTPEYAVISVGHNSYGHPAQETLERLAAAGCDIYRTDGMGTVTMTVRGE